MLKSWKFIANVCLAISFCHITIAQETTSEFSGRIRTADNQYLSNATITVVHEPTQSKSQTISRVDGHFYFFNLKPGGPYTLDIRHAEFETFSKSNLFFNLIPNQNLQESRSEEFVLAVKVQTLQHVKIDVKNYKNSLTTLGANISSTTLETMPSISRNFHDYLRVVPQAVITRDGGISLAGQNNRFNAFFIDGANNNDILGLAASGTNGGQTGSPPISMEALEQITVVLAPYDVQFSNFTGGSINAITRSGSNRFSTAAWHYFRNEHLAGRSPIPVEKPGAPNVFERPRLSNFLNQTTGIRAGGPVIQNKLFYFFLAETQSEFRPQPFNISEYRGLATTQQLKAIADFLLSQYQYDPGTFLESEDILKAYRFMTRFDWNPSTKNKFTFSLRYNKAKRAGFSNPSGSTLVQFSNSGIAFPATSYTSAFEWKLYLKNGSTNRMLLTFTSEIEDRKWLGNPFPRTSIIDGPASIIFGFAPNSGVSLFKGRNLAFSNVFKTIWKAHTLTSGVDFNYNKILDSQIPNYFGTYQFKSLNDFMTGIKPIRYQRSFSQLDQPEGDHTLAAAKFNTLHLGVFLNDNIHINNMFTITFGIRFDNNFLPSHTYTDRFFNDTAIHIISQYYDLREAKAGIQVRPHWQLSPRFGFTYRIPKQQMLIQGGGGVFTGHILNVWASVLHSRNGRSIGSLDINPQQYNLSFNPDPYNQPIPQTLGINEINAKGELDLIAKKFKYPTVFKSSLAVSKSFAHGWKLSGEAIVTFNIFETQFTNVNILPAIKRSSGPGSRDVYSTGANPMQIPLRSGGANPYTGNVFLMTNNQGKKGSSYNLTLIINKHWNDNLNLTTTYTFGKSTVLFEPSYNISVYNNQWRGTESINGKNGVHLSKSDVDLGQRITTCLNKKFNYRGGRIATTISIFYNGQSGSNYSYVYNGSIVNDDGNRQSMDLIYIPTSADLAIMNFLTINTPGGSVLYTVEQQREMLNQFIESDKYLRKNRGNFASRNGARLPFTNMIDLRLQQDFKIKSKEKTIVLNVLYDVFNILNLINKDWGRIYYLPGDNYPLIRFNGFINNTTIPQYQFTPPEGKVYSIQPGTVPGSSARWISQLGFKIMLE